MRQRAQLSEGWGRPKIRVVQPRIQEGWMSPGSQGGAAANFNVFSNGGGLHSAFSHWKTWPMALFLHVDEHVRCHQARDRELAVDQSWTGALALTCRASPKAQQDGRSRSKFCFQPRRGFSRRPFERLFKFCADHDPCRQAPPIGSLSVVDGNVA